MLVLMTSADLKLFNTYMASLFST